MFTRRPEIPRPHCLGVSSLINELSLAINESQLYVEPTATQTTRFVRTFNREVGHYPVFFGCDEVSWRKCMVMLNDIGDFWGLYLKDLSGPTRLLIEAPHPVYDENTEFIARDIWRRVPASVLMVAGAERSAGGPGGTGSSQGLADPPWNEGSMFNQMSQALMPLPQLQVHGFRNSTAPDYDIVLSNGSAPSNALATGLADALDGSFRVARVWDGFDTLTAVGNRQSINARDSSSPFIHMEINYSVRTSSSLTATLVDIVSGYLRSSL